MDIGDIKYLDQPAKVLKLSEAIRIGSRIRPQCTVKIFRDGGSCVWGAAYEARGGQYIEGGRFGDMSPIISAGEYVEADEAYKRKYGFGSWWDNDRGISREAIADRLEALGY